MRLAAALACLLAAGCLRLTFVQTSIHTPLSRERVAMLEPGVADLTTCLALLGAPVLAWEYDGEGMALAWGWRNDSSDGLLVSVPVANQLSADLQLESARRNLRGFVLFFGPDLVLQRVREGFLRDLVPAQKRPAPLEDLGEAPPAPQPAPTQDLHDPRN